MMNQNALAPVGNSTHKPVRVPDKFMIDRGCLPRENFIDLRDSTKLDYLQVLTKRINVTPNIADVQQFNHGATKG